MNIMKRKASPLYKKWSSKRKSIKKLKKSNIFIISIIFFVKFRKNWNFFCFILLPSRNVVKLHTSYIVLSINLTTIKLNVKLVSAIFYQIFISNQMTVLQCFLFHLKSSFSSRDIQIFVFPSFPLFLSVSHCFRGWSKINLKVYNVINCLNKNLIKYFV